MGRKVLVGLLLLGALFIFGLATFYVENLQFYLGKGYRLHARFPVAQTLNRGDVVRLQGVPVGTVDSLTVNTELTGRYPVEATLWIQSGYEIRAEDTAVIRMGSLFGGYFVAIERGDTAAPVLKNGDYLANTRVSPSITQVVERSAETLASIRTAFENVSGLVDKFTTEGSLGELLQDEDVIAKIRSTVTDTQEAAEDIRTAAERLQAGEGVVGRLLTDNQLATDLQSLTTDLKETAMNARNISADLKEGKGTLGGLLKDPRMAEDLRETLAEAREAVASLKQVAADVRQGEGTLSKLLTSDEAYLKLDSSLDDLNEFTAALSRNEGTLARLMKDDELYGKLQQIADDLQGMLDTYREQSPVISLAGAVFGAF